MSFIFKKTARAEDFFKILPLDWQFIIVPQWKDYKTSSDIYVIEIDNSVVAGGIVFKKMPPNATVLEMSYSYLFEQSYLYLGFIFVLPEYRNQKLASFWLENIKKTYKNGSFWLTIEDYSLKSFYEKNGFSIINHKALADSDEWAMVFSQH